MIARKVALAEKSRERTMQYRMSLAMKLHSRAIAEVPPEAEQGRWLT